MNFDIDINERNWEFCKLIIEREFSIGDFDIKNENLIWDKIRYLIYLEFLLQLNHFKMNLILLNALKNV